jgi:hypothetical protein
VSKEKFWGSLFFFVFISFCCFSYENSTRSVLPAKLAYAELCLKLMLLKTLHPCRERRSGRLRAPEFLVSMLVDNINFTFPAFPVLSGYRNEFRGAEVYYFSRILTCARLTFFPSGIYHLSAIIRNEHTVYIRAHMYSSATVHLGRWYVRTYNAAASCRFTWHLASSLPTAIL